MMLRAERIERLGQVELLRRIRNACRDGFSHDTHEISPIQQRTWWQAHRGRMRAWLYADGDTFVGYGLLRQTEDGRWWSSVAVLPEHNGRGYGGTITADLVRRSDEPVWATARLDNPAAIRLHREADWEWLGQDERLVHFRTRPHVHLADALAEWEREGWVIS